MDPLKCLKCRSMDVGDVTDSTYEFVCNNCDHHFNTEEDSEEQAYRDSLSPEDREQYDSNIWH